MSEDAMHWTELDVKWGDTDAGGLIYFPRFFHYFVVGLNAYFEPASEHLMESFRTNGYRFPAVDASASFESPVRAGDTVRVGAAVSKLGEASLTVEFAVERAGDGTDVADGMVTFVRVDENFEPAPLPEWVRDCIRERRR